ncbi:hypothetical protein G6F46_011409 [Rhizopus delemar]|nr:hypothetical protein G6F36_011739 [Rhizopus arrhizus]KAG1447917.1 hypothetical protein G6F55_010894 [Rhizopus delemar]KAG1489884.1 hypothetical protein G6F54_011125 [Rhizopus delemar]KAG1500606.1 hypothetical protein G6F53_011266 [Rhizopus delemar]KAG1521537.1 hypothetical protein G6F52_006657 [Rhizopus delemar]
MHRRIAHARHDQDGHQEDRAVVIRWVFSGCSQWLFSVVWGEGTGEKRNDVDHEMIDMGLIQRDGDRALVLVGSQVSAYLGRLPSGYQLTLLTEYARTYHHTKNGSMTSVPADDWTDLASCYHFDCLVSFDCRAGLSPKSIRDQNRLVKTPLQENVDDKHSTLLKTAFYMQGDIKRTKELMSAQ